MIYKPLEWRSCGCALWACLPLFGMMARARKARFTTHAKRLVQRYGPPVASALAQRAMSSYTRTATAGSSEPGGVLTGHFDAKTDYKRRRLGKRQRRKRRSRYLRTRRMVRAVRNFDVGSTHLVKMNYAGLTTAAGVSDAYAFGLYGLNGSTTQYNNTSDIAQIFTAIDPTSWAAVNAGATAGVNYRIYASHGTAEYTLRNTSANDAIVEAYFIRGRKPINYAYAMDPVQAYSAAFKKQALAKDPTTGASLSATELAYTQLGVTPFQAALFCRDFSIYKRQKFVIPAGGDVSFVITDRRPRTFTMAQARTFSTDRNYHGVLFQQFGPPDASGGTPTPALSSSVTYMCTRRYRIKMFRDNLPLDASLT